MATVADDALNTQGVNRMLGAGVDTTQVFQQQILRMNADDQAHAMAARRTDATTTQLITYLGGQAFLGEAPVDAAAILSYRATGAQPQSGGGPGQPVNFPVQQQLPLAPAVYSINPTTGVITKA